MNCVITFDSIHRVMKAEKLLREGNVPISLIPTPRQISSDCGMVISVTCQELERVQKILNENNLEIEGIYENGKKMTRRHEKADII